MNTTTQHDGPQRAGDTLEITELKRLQREIEIRQGLIDGCRSADTILREIRQVVLNTWTGRTTAGDPVHIHYQVGVLTIEVDAPNPRGTRSPVAVMRWNPHITEIAIAGGLIAIHGGGEGKRTWTGITLQVADVVAGAGEVVAAGGHCEREPQWEDGEPPHLAMYEDPEGNQFMLSRQRS